jgi:hypothetical protein
MERLTLKGEEECSHASYDLVLNILEKNILIYFGPEKFAIRKQELMQRKPGRRPVSSNYQGQTE